MDADSTQKPLSLILDEIECFKCGETKPLTDFNWNNQRNCVARPCKACIAAACKERRSNIDIATGYARSSHQHYEKNRGIYKTRDKIRVLQGYRPRARANPLKEQARGEVRNAVRRKGMVKPDRCDRCKTVTAKRCLHGHHKDYDKPLDVAWLCSTCHGKEHRKYVY